jgi:glycosyltransferase involved in cell wall biosynthesis
MVFISATRPSSSVSVSETIVKIIHYNHAAEDYGINTFLQSLLAYQSRTEDLEIAVVFCVDGQGLNKYRRMGIKVFGLGLASARKPKAFSILRRLFAEYDIVNLHTLAPWAFLAAVAAGCRVIYTFHGAIGMRLLFGIPLTSLFVKFLFLPRCDHLTFASQASRDHFLKSFGVDRLHDDRVSVFPYGLLIDGIRSGRSRHEMRKELDVDGAFVVGTAMRLVPIKRPDLLIRAFASAKISSRCCLLILGAGPEHFVSSLHGLARELGVGESVRFMGFRKDAYDVMQALDVFVMPSRREPFGLALLEAMTLGLPCVAMSDGGGTVDIIGGAGLVAERLLNPLSNLPRIRS